MNFIDKPDKIKSAYGWGDPEAEEAKEGKKILGNYKFIKDNYLKPYIKDKVVLDFGCGFGKWIQFMFSAKKIIGVDLRSIIVDINFPIQYYITKDGMELKGIKSKSVDFVFSMDALVRNEIKIIYGAMTELERVMKDDACFCIHLPYVFKLGSSSRNEIVKEIFRKMLVTFELTYVPSKKSVCKLCSTIGEGITFWVQENYGETKCISKFFVCNYCLSSIISKNKDVMFG
jgi:SAM-dependent methyltransferase